MKYTIEIGVIGKFVTDVEADSQDEAIDLARDKYDVADSGAFEIYEDTWLSVNGDEFIE